MKALLAASLVALIPACAGGAAGPPRVDTCALSIESRSTPDVRVPDVTSPDRTEFAVDARRRCDAICSGHYGRAGTPYEQHTCIEKVLLEAELEPPIDDGPRLKTARLLRAGCQLGHAGACAWVHDHPDEVALADQADTQWVEDSMETQRELERAQAARTAAMLAQQATERATARLNAVAVDAGLHLVTAREVALGSDGTYGAFDFKAGHRYLVVFLTASASAIEAWVYDNFDDPVVLYTFPPMDEIDGLFQVSGEFTLEVAGDGVAVDVKGGDSSLPLTFLLYGDAGSD